MTPTLSIIVLGQHLYRQEIPGITGILGLGVQNEAGQRSTEFCQENALQTPTANAVQT